MRNTGEPWEYWALQTQGRPGVTVNLSQKDGKWLEQGLVQGERRVGTVESGARTRRPVPGVTGLSLGPMWGPVQTGVLSPPRLQTAARGAWQSRQSINVASEHREYRLLRALSHPKDPLLLPPPTHISQQTKLNPSLHLPQPTSLVHSWLSESCLPIRSGSKGARDPVQGKASP